MKAAIVREAGQLPAFGDFDEPSPIAGGVLVTVSAAAISPLVKGRAAGTHYSSTDGYPFVVGVDGVGRLSDGRRVYFMLPRAPFGSMSERTVVAESNAIPVPDGLGDLTAAAIANPGMSAWAAFSERAKLAAGETVLVNGATGSAGRMAVQIAKQMGARKVIATGRNPEALASLGADAVLQLGEGFAEELKGHFAVRIDVVIDYLWGESAEAILKSAASSSPNGVQIRYVQVGATSGPEITLPGALLRSSGLHLMGSGLGSVPNDRLLQSIRSMFEAAVPAGFTIASTTAPLSSVSEIWNADNGGKRVVLTIDRQP